MKSSSKSDKKYRDFASEAEKGLPAWRVRRARKLAAEEIKLIKLSQLREQLGVRQTEVRGFTQSNVSRLEARKDMKLSTLIQYLRSLGLEIEIRAIDTAGDSEKELVLLRA